MPGILYMYMLINMAVQCKTLQSAGEIAVVLNACCSYMVEVIAGNCWMKMQSPRWGLDWGRVWLLHNMNSNNRITTLVRKTVAPN